MMLSPRPHQQHQNRLTPSFPNLCHSLPQPINKHHKQFHLWPQNQILLSQFLHPQPWPLPDHLRKEKLLPQQCCKIFLRSFTCLYVEMPSTENPPTPPRPPFRPQPPPELTNSLPDPRQSPYDMQIPLETYRCTGEHGHTDVWGHSDIWGI